MNDQLGIVFIHGAGLGNYIWNGIGSTLNYPSLLIEFPNRNADDKANAKLNFDDYVVKAIADTQSFGKEQLIIVTHSIGGLIGLRIAEHFKDRTIGFVGIASAIPSNGSSFISCLPFPQKIVIPLLMKLVGTRPPRSTIEKELCNDLNPAQTKTVVEHFTAESRYLYTENSKSKIPDTKKLYVELTNDKGFPLSVQRKMIKNLNCKNTETLESGHLPMLSVPKKLLGILSAFIEHCIESGESFSDHS